MPERAIQCWYFADPYLTFFSGCMSGSGSPERRPVKICGPSFLFGLCICRQFATGSRAAPGLAERLLDCRQHPPRGSPLRDIDSKVQAFACTRGAPRPKHLHADPTFLQSASAGSVHPRLLLQWLNNYEWTTAPWLPPGERHSGIDIQAGGEPSLECRHWHAG